MTLDLLVEELRGRVTRLEELLDRPSGNSGVRQLDLVVGLMSRDPDRALTAREVADELSIPTGSARLVLYAHDGVLFKRSRLSPGRVCWHLIDPLEGHEAPD